jgi:hypothetical protein
MAMMRTLVYALLIVLTTALLAACGTAAPAATSGEEEGEEGGVEAALVTYADTNQNFAIGHPSPWQQDGTVKDGVKFIGGDSSMTLEFATLTDGMDAMTYAQNDVANIGTAYPGFKQLSLAPSTEVQGAVVLGFEADGKSVVTGKEFTAHDERYYIPIGGGRLAVLTVVGPENLYDREGVRDIALTLRMSN